MPDSVLDDLKAQIAARRIVVVVGSGASIASTRNAAAASWSGLLKTGVQRCVDLDSTLAGGWQERALADVTSRRLDDLLAGASKVARTLRRHGEWPRWLADTIGKLETVEPALFDAIGKLDAPILTTNYDDLIDRRLHRASITWKDGSEQISFARLESRDAVLHLHGYWRQPETIVLDIGDYERVVGDPLAQAGLRTMGEAWSLVFIGCGDGLADPNFEQFLEWMGTVLRDSRHRHFRLERAPDVFPRQTWHNDRGHRVRVLSYGDEYPDLPSFLAGLKPWAPSPISTTATTATSPAGSRLARPVLTSGEYVRLQERGRTAVQQLIALANQLGFGSIASHGAEISETLEQDLYRVAITGRSRAGKSTLLNALVGRAICPVERVITTAIPIIIGPGEIETATVTFERNVRPPLLLDGPITSDMLAPYADQRHNPNNAKNVERIEIHLGHEVLDLGVEYVDIPGFDDPSGKIWSSTSEVIKTAHALVLVLDVSTYESGGFALDKATRELLESAHRRACPVLIVCNKADKLSSSDKAGAVKHLRDELERFGLQSGLPRPPFTLSAREATEACARRDPIPSAMVAFEEALWEQLWNTESVGLRRLHKVFDALRVADEEVTALMRVRSAKGPERETLRDAIGTCREDLGRIRSKSARDTQELRTLAGKAVEGARTEYLCIIAEHVASFPAAQEIPTVSATVEALKEHLSEGCRSVLEELELAVSSRYESVDKAVSRSLTRLREKTGPTVQSREARDTLETLSRLISGVAVPGSDDAERAIKVAGAGFGTVAAIGFAVGGPLGWLLGSAAGLVVSAIVDHITDSVDTREKLQERVVRHAKESFASFARTLDDAIATAGTRLDRRVFDRMQPFLSDMELRLDAIREPTTDELELHEEIRRTTSGALELLVRLLGGRVRALDTSPPSEPPRATEG